jgi:hypothetical protein
MNDVPHITPEQAAELIARGIERADMMTFELTREEARTLVSEGVKQAFTEVGLGGEPIELQRDFTHLRKWRTSIDAASNTGFKVVTGTIVAGLLGALWMGITTMLHR